MRRRSAGLTCILAFAVTGVLAGPPQVSPGEAEAASLLRDAQSLWHKREFGDALARLARLQDLHGTTPSAPDAGLWTARALVALGDPVSAMEELQRVRNRWPGSTAAAAALADASLLRRLYVLPAGAPAFGAPERLGPERVENVGSIALTAKGAIYRGGQRGVEPVRPADGDHAPTGAFSRPKLALDRTGGLVVVDTGKIVPAPPGKAIDLQRPRSGRLAPLEKPDAAVQLHGSGEWLVMDGDEKMLQRFAADGKYLQPFETTPGRNGPVKVSALAVSAFDEIAGLDGDGSRVVLFDATGAIRGSIPFRRRPAELRDAQDTAYELRDPRDLAFDAFGHLFVLDQRALAVFGPYSSAVEGAARPGAPRANRGDDYRLRLLFSEPASRGRDGFRALAFAIDRSGALVIYDEGLKQVLVYR